MFDIGYILIVLIPTLVLSGLAQWMVKSRFNKYSRVAATRGYTGAQAAQRLLDQAGIHDVQVVPTRGYLSDHYNPINKTLALSEPVYNSTSVAALGVATHEAGHAIQHKVGYLPLQLRSAIVPLAGIGSQLGMLGMMIGLFLMAVAGVFGKVIFMLGAILFCGLVLFQLITLPVEFDASARAKHLVVEAGIVGPMEREGIDKVLNAAALTYVAAFVSSLLTLAYFVFRSGILGGDD